MDKTPYEEQERLHREGSIEYRLQALVGQCMFLGEDLHKEGDLISEGIVQAAREMLVKAAARREVPLEVKDG